ncbi:unnamed protein product [Cuscuta campestris]|uniref:Uncharacterized protein n=1 Tax=Cuscuta campestris TaxID=132261 RepID=A0A484LCY3_9ASTE|nr:unnamed protein product [Cuscuta campestris]
MILGHLWVKGISPWMMRKNRPREKLRDTMAGFTSLEAMPTEILLSPEKSGPAIFWSPRSRSGSKRDEG